MKETLPTAPRTQAEAFRQLRAAPVAASPCGSPVGRGLTATSANPSQPPLIGPRGPSPLLNRCSGLVCGAEVSPHPTMLREGDWGSAQVLAEQGHHAAAAQGCGYWQPHNWSHPWADTSWEGGEQSWPWPCWSQESPHCSPWCQEVNIQPMAQSMCPAAGKCQTGLELCWGTSGGHQIAVWGCARACSGSPGCSPREARSRENGVQSGTASRANRCQLPPATFSCLVPTQSHRKAPGVSLG